MPCDHLYIIYTLDSGDSTYVPQFSPTHLSRHLELGERGPEADTDCNTINSAIWPKGTEDSILFRRGLVVQKVVIC